MKVLNFMLTVMSLWVLLGFIIHQDRKIQRLNNELYNKTVEVQHYKYVLDTIDNNLERMIREYDTIIARNLRKGIITEKNI